MVALGLWVEGRRRPLPASHPELVQGQLLWLFGGGATLSLTPAPLPPYPRRSNSR